MVKHSQSKKHEAAEDRQKQLDGLNAAQPSIADFNDNQGADARLRQLMIVVLWICKSDASIAMFVSLVRLLYDLRTPHIPEKSPGSYQSEYGFKQITEALVVYLRAQQMKHIQQSPFVGIQLDESTDRRRGKHMIVYLTFLKNAKVVDITKVAQLVENTCSILRSRYVEYGVNFGEDSKLLTEFLEEHGPKNKRMVTVEGIDGAGNPTAHTFKLHEKALSGQKSEGDMESCISLVTLFVQAIIRNLESRMESLNSLRGSKLFFPDAYPDSVAKRDRLCAEWFGSLKVLFNAEQCALPGVDWGKAERELPRFTRMLHGHYKDTSFHNCLKNILRSEDWRTSYPNLCSGGRQQMS
ncbi:hypothetical protein CLOP_g18394 [Closterium sp. NIES-67]|nr:hypothetical protein CLOP_g18394 [Closterium sp. NIES-67]